jgi:hypothetical protein
LEREVRHDLSRRNEAERQLQQHIETELQGLTERLTGQMSDLQIMVKNGMDNLNRTVEDLSSALATEKEQRKLDVDHVGSKLCARLDEIVQTVDDERFARLEQERQSLRRCAHPVAQSFPHNRNRLATREEMSCFCIKKHASEAPDRWHCSWSGTIVSALNELLDVCFRIGEDLYKLNERVECERKCREHAIGELAGELHDFATTRNAQEEQRTLRLTEELCTLRNKLCAEEAARMQEDEAIVQAINEYTKALQAGLRIVGST